jgi:hypothetical protein
MNRFLYALAVASVVSGGASAATNDRTYDTAVTCKALSLLASRATDPDSKAALKLIDAEIANEIEIGKTPEQAAADVEYARYEWRDTMSQETIDVEWVACVKKWRD